MRSIQSSLDRVGVEGFEPPTSSTQSSRTTWLCYTPSSAVFSPVVSARLATFQPRWGRGKRNGSTLRVDVRPPRVLSHPPTITVLPVDMLDIMADSFRSDEKECFSVSHTGLEPVFSG